jgi:MerR family copper efflux transcriptional regulator
MKIGELAQKTGLATSTIRFYEEQGLIQPPTRGANGYRYYDDSDLRRLHMVMKVQKLGFSLDAIRGLFIHDGQCSKSRTLEQIDIRLEEVAQLEATLMAQRAELISLRDILEASIRTGLDPVCTVSPSPDQNQFKYGDMSIHNRMHAKGNRP